MRKILKKKSLNFALFHKFYRFIFLGHWNCIKIEYTEKQEEEEHLPLISKNQCDKGMKLTLIK